MIKLFKPFKEQADFVFISVLFFFLLRSLLFYISSYPLSFSPRFNVSYFTSFIIISYSPLYFLIPQLIICLLLLLYNLFLLSFSVFLFSYSTFRSPLSYPFHLHLWHILFRNIFFLLLVRKFSMLQSSFWKASKLLSSCHIIVAVILWLTASTARFDPIVEHVWFLIGRVAVRFSTKTLISPAYFYSKLCSTFITFRTILSCIVWIPKTPLNNKKICHSKGVVFLHVSGSVVWGNSC